MKTGGYSLLEVLIALFLLTGVVMASFSIFENGGGQTVKLEDTMTACRLAQQICEVLRAGSASAVADLPDRRFAPPFNHYLYSVDTEIFPDAARPPVGNLIRFTVHVRGPVDGSGNSAPQTASVRLSALMGRQPYP